VQPGSSPALTHPNRTCSPSSVSLVPHQPNCGVLRSPPAAGRVCDSFCRKRVSE
jgi:hypothetical protein